jgi:outer membrane protein assembly factor BamB
LTLERDIQLPESLDQVFQGQVPGSGLREGLPELVNFQICEPLGQGGMGMVYRAVQEYPQRTVALKVMRPTIWQARAAARFQREIQILARLQHPAIARLYTAGTMTGPGGDSPFLAMELVLGEPVTAFVRGKSLTERLRVAIEICDAVGYAHGEGILHRDLKPANVLVEASGHVKILDFGLGTLLTQGQDLPALTEAGQFLGTPDYMSPEQAAGRKLDERADVYSLGVLLYELVAGRRPVDLSSHSMLEASRMIKEEDAPSLRSVCPGASRDLEIIVAKAMAKEVHRRYGSAAALADDLRRLLDNRPIAARRSTAFYRTGRLLRRHRYLAVSTALVIASLAAGLGLALCEARNARMHDRLAQIQLAEAQVAQGDMCLSTGDVARARRLYDSAREGFLKTQSSPLPASLGLWELDARTAFPLRTLELSEAPQSVTLSQDGFLLGLLKPDGKLIVEDALTGKKLWEAPMGVSAGRVMFSPNAVVLALLSTDGLILLDSKSGEVLRSERVALEPTLLVTGNDGFCAKSADGQLIVVPINPSLPLVHVQQEGLEPVAGFDVGGHLWTTARDGSVYRASAPRWVLEKTGQVPRTLQERLTIGGDARWLIKESGGQLEFWSLDPLERSSTISAALPLPGMGAPPGMVFRFDRSIGLVELVNTSGEVVLRMPAKAPHQVTSGGDLFFVGDGSSSLTLWQNRSTRSIRRLAAESSGASAISGDGRIAAIPAGMHLNILDTDSGKLIAHLNTGKPIVDVSMDKTGSTLALCTADKGLEFWTRSHGDYEVADDVGFAARKVALAPGGHTAISCDGDEPPRYWTRGSQGTWSSYPLALAEANFARFAEDDTVALIAGTKQVHIWSTGEHPRPLYSIGLTASIVHGAVFVGPDSDIVTLSASGDLARWSKTTGKFLGAMELPPTRITSIASSDGLVFGLDQAKNLSVYDSSGRLVRVISVSNGGNMEGGGGKVLAARRGLVELMDFSALPYHT